MNLNLYQSDIDAVYQVAASEALPLEPYVNLVDDEEALLHIRDIAEMPELPEKLKSFMQITPASNPFVGHIDRFLQSYMDEIEIMEGPVRGVPANA